MSEIDNIYKKNLKFPMMTQVVAPSMRVTFRTSLTRGQQPALRRHELQRHGDGLVVQ